MYLMSGRPVTIRLDDELLDAVDAAVAAGRAANRSVAIAEAVGLWLAARREQEIVESYRRRYQSGNAEMPDLLELADEAAQSAAQ
jgi:Arc/MetJ-type ribon-helix-helix transcriptional regulator